MPLSLSHAPAMLIFLKNGPNQGALSCTKHQKNAKGFLRLPAHSSQGSHEAPNPFPNFILSSFHLPAPTCVATRDTQPPPPPTPPSDISQFSGPLLLSSCSMDHPHPPPLTFPRFKSCLSFKGHLAPHWFCGFVESNLPPTERLNHLLPPFLIVFNLEFSYAAKSFVSPPNTSSSGQSCFAFWPLACPAWYLVMCQVCAESNVSHNHSHFNFLVFLIRTLFYSFSFCLRVLRHRVMGIKRKEQEGKVESKNKDMSCCVVSPPRVCSI